MQYSIPSSTNDSPRRKGLWLESSKLSVPTVKLSSLYSPCAIVKLVLILYSSIQVLHADDRFEDHEHQSTKMATSAFKVVPEKVISRSSSAYQTEYDSYFVAITTYNPDENSRKATNGFSYQHDTTRNIVEHSSELKHNNQLGLDVKKPLALAINISSIPLESMQNSPSINIKDQSQFYNTTIASSKTISGSSIRGEQI